MFSFTHPAVRIVAATLLGAFVPARPLPAASGDLAGVAAAMSRSTQEILTQEILAQEILAQEILAQATPSEATPPAAPEESASTEAKEKAAVDAHVEARIKALHSKLHITPAQETQWNAVAQVMRDNAHAIADLREERAEQAKSMNAVEHLKAYEAITDAQAAGIHKFRPAFQTLYDAMSDSQKKTADALFRGRALATAKKHN